MPTAINSISIDANETPAKNSDAGHQYNAESYDQIIPAVRTPITAGSGGTQLQNIPCGKLWIRSASGNQLMFIGGVNEHAPFSGRGMSLYASEVMWLPVKNSNVVSVMATHSGEFIEYLGYLAGNNVSINLSGIYIAPDTTPPTVLTVTPASGASGSTTASVISATFSEPMASGTINTNSFVLRISGSGTALSGTVVLQSNLTTAVFTPSSGIIETSKVYNAYLGTAIQDIGANPLNSGVSGLWTWTTQAAPFIVSVQPTSGGSGIATNNEISVVFSQNMMSGTITTTAFTVRSGATSNVNLSGVAFLNSSDTTEAVFIPYSGIIQTSGTYFARLATSIKDAYGNPLNASGVWSWTTAAGAPPPDTTPPRVSGTTPISGASGVAFDVNTLVNFSEQVQSGTVNTTNLFLRLSGSAIPAAVTLASDLKTATINPTSNLLNGQTYLINVLSGVRDLAGNFLSPYLSGKQFTTLPLVFSTQPASGAIDIAINTDVTITFSGYNMASGSVTTDSMVLQLSGNIVPSTVSLDPDLLTARLNPNDNLYYSQTYYLNASGIQDVNGNYITPISTLPFTTIDATYNTVYNVAQDGNDDHFDSNKFRIGTRIQGTSPLIGKNVQSVKVYMHREGAVASGASGVIMIGDWADGTQDIFGYKNPALFNSGVFSSFTFTNPNIIHQLAANDKIYVQWLSGTSAGNRVAVARTASNAFVGAIEVQLAGATYSGAAWSVEDAIRDLAGVMYSTN